MTALNLDTNPNRNHHLPSDISLLSEGKRAELDPIVEDLLNSHHPRIVVVVESIPEEDLEPNPTLPNVFQLRDTSETALISTYITIQTEFICSSLQKTGYADSFVGGQRTPKNHSLIVIVR